MKTIQLKTGNWFVEALPDDGARLSQLKFKEYNLLTLEPDTFIPPEKDYGGYELRPVYGYDDCFPSVEPCFHPTVGFYIRDHGDICWLKWKVETLDNKLICSTVYDLVKVKFQRTLDFNEDSLIWSFDLSNRSDKNLEFIHVVHPLMPLAEVTEVIVPRFDKVFEAVSSSHLKSDSPGKLNEHLNSIKQGQFEMLFLENVREGFIKLKFRNGMRLQMIYDQKLFPTMGIWWNNHGYPDEKGVERCECAFEPVPGINSNLEETFKAGRYLNIAPGKTFSWSLEWKIDS